MKIRRTFQLAYFFCLFVPAAYSQQKIYFKVGGGYASPLAPYNIGMNTKQTMLREANPESGDYITAIIRETTEVNGSYGAGFNGSLTIGYPITEIIGVEINGSYFHGKKYKASSILREIVDDEVFFSSSGKSTSRADIILITPALILNAPGNPIRPYLSAGIVFAFATMEEQFYTTSDFDLEKMIQHAKYTGGISIGMHGSVGLDFKLTESLSLFSEIPFNSITYYPKEKEIVKYEIDGQNFLQTMDESFKRTVFVKSVKSDSRNGMSDNSKPRREQRISFAMSNLNANVGLKIKL